MIQVYSKDLCDRITSTAKYCLSQLLKEAMSNQDQSNVYIAFEQATRQKLRFASVKGQLSVEDLWSLPLTTSQPAVKPSLDEIAKQLNRELKEAEHEVSFVAPAASTAGQKQNELRFTIVKHIITTLIAERDAASRERDRAAQKQKIMEIMARKKDQAMEDMSEAELAAALAAL